MRRRDFVKGLLAASAAAKSIAAQQAAPAAPHVLPPPGPVAPGPVAPGPVAPAPVAPGPVPWMRGLMEVKPLELSTLVPDAVAQTDAHFFNAQQTATLRRLCAVLMPPLKGFPGALETGAPEFLDFLIGSSPRPRKLMYQSGLDRLHAESLRKFAVPFEKTNNPQADALIRPWLRAWMSDHPPTEPHARFINLAHHDIRTATVNSQGWSEASRAAGETATGLDLYWYPVDPDLHRDQQAALRKSPPPAHG